MKSSKVVVQNFLRQLFSPGDALRPSLQRGFFSSLWWLFSSAIEKKTNNLEENILEVSCINTRGNAGRDHWNGEKANTPPKTVPRVSLILVFWEEKVVGCVTQRKKCWVHSEAVLSHLGAHYSCEVSRWKYVPFSNECTRGQNPALKELVVTNRKFVVNKKYRLQRKKNWTSAWTHVSRFFHRSAIQTP